MTLPVFIWGLIALVAGVGIGVYGSMRFRFALAAMGFAIWFVAVLALLDGQDPWLRLVVAIVAGGIAAAILFSLIPLIPFGLYIAGAVLGLIVALLVSSVISLLSGGLATIVVIVLALVGPGLGGVLGPRLGDFVIILATSAAGAYLIATGLHAWFSPEIGGGPSDLTSMLAQQMTLTVFVVVAVICILSQRISMDLRRRLLH